MSTSLVNLKKDVSVSLMYLVADLNSAHSKLAVREVLQRIRAKSMDYIEAYYNLTDEGDTE